MKGYELSKFDCSSFIFNDSLTTPRFLIYIPDWLGKASQQVTRRIFRYVSARLEFECFTLGQSPSPLPHPRDFTC